MTEEYTHMTIAGKEIGQGEVHGGGHNARVLEYHQATKLRATTDETPWCAAFVCWVLSKANLWNTESAMARSYLKWGLPTKGQRGDVVIFWRKSPKSSSGHVGFVISKGLFKIKVLGGNQNNKVCIQKYWRFMVLGYRRPAAGWAV